jgi:hypothetical protein
MNNINDLISKVKANELSTIYSKDDVLRMLDSLVTSKTIIARAIIDGFIDELERVRTEDLLDGDFTFAINHDNVVMIDDYPGLDEQRIESILADTINKCFGEDIV